MSAENEVEFRAFRKRLLWGSFLICAVAAPLGLLLHLTAVWILGLAGIVIAGIKVQRMH
ncbi:MAG: hypothetical protein HUU16_10570 [Candidatus Omnitrophica bacterium]|nr:hypothetical protein [bacterium]NUN96605.1 hypothetical protein [Candidatus Omnitrophota bacterium]